MGEHFGNVEKHISRWKSYIASPANPVGKENEMEIVEGNSFRGDKYNCVSPSEKDTDADSSDDGLQRITSGNEHTEEKVPTFLGTTGNEYITILKLKQVTKLWNTH